MWRHSKVYLGQDPQHPVSPTVRLTGRTAFWDFPVDVILHDGQGVHLLCMAGMHGHHRQASQPVSPFPWRHACGFWCAWGRKSSFLPRKTQSMRWLQWVPVVSHIGEDVAVTVAHRQRRKEVFWAWNCILKVGNPRVGLCWQEHPFAISVLVLFAPRT